MSSQPTSSAAREQPSISAAYLRPFLFLVVAALGTTVGGCGGGGGSGDGDGDGDGDQPCVPGALLCDGSRQLDCVDGELVPGATCPDVCVDGLGCVLCEPGRGTCNSAESATVCSEDGQGYEEQVCDPVQGTSCDESVGACAGACSKASLGSSYIGCEYYPTITGNGLIGQWDFAVIVSNTSGFTAHVRIEGGAANLFEEFTVEAGAVAVKRLAYDPVMQFCNSVLGDFCTVAQPYGGMRTGGAFRLRSDQPVTVYQFSPLDYRKPDGQLSFSNDASLLLPTTSLRRDYFVATWPTWLNPDRNAYPGIVAITATEDQTEVTIVPTGFALPFGRPGRAETVNLDRGDVLQLASDLVDFNPNQPTQYGEDLTGTRVSSDKPIQVIGAHFCTRIPLFKDACDHLEDSMFPVEALSNRYVVAAPYSASFARAPSIARIIATEPNTTLSFEPPIPSVGSAIESAGEFVEIGPQSADFVVTANHKILVAQYMLAETVVGTGDPSMNIPSPIEQWRTTYLFHAPTNYEQNLVSIVGATGVQVSLDGTAVTGWEAIGSSGFQTTRVSLDDSGDGNHRIEASSPVGIGVYGYGEATSYWYPGGLDLDRIIVQ